MPFIPHEASRDTLNRIFHVDSSHAHLFQLFIISPATQRNNAEIKVFFFLPCLTNPRHKYGKDISVLTVLSLILISPSDSPDRQFFEPSSRTAVQGQNVRHPMATFQRKMLHTFRLIPCSCEKAPPLYIPKDEVEDCSEESHQATMDSSCRRVRISEGDSCMLFLTSSIFERTSER